MHNYSIAMEALINEIGAAVYRKDYWENGDAERKFGPIKNSPVPFIPCQYHNILVAKLPNGHYPGGNMYPDKSWEGARVTGSGARRRTEYYGGFNVIKDSRGRCLIPDTPNNRARLQGMASGTKQVFETQMFLDPKGVQRSRRVMLTVTAPAPYTMLEEANANGNLEEMMRLAVEKALRERDERDALPPPEIIEAPVHRVEADPGVVDLRAPAPATESGQPVSPDAGEGQTASPPANGPQPTNRTRRAPASLAPAAVATATSAAAASGDADF